MKKYPFYLIFFAINYSLMKAMPLQYLVLVPLALIAFEGLFLAGMYYLTRDISRAGFLTLLFFGWLLYFGVIAQLANSMLHMEYSLRYLLLFLLPWTLAFILLGSSWLWRRIKSPQMATSFLNLVFFAILLVPSYNMVASLVYSKAHTFFEPLKLDAANPVTEIDTDTLPDIYYIILDSYGRQDTLLDYLNIDNSQFIQFLESRGFYVAGQSHSNYDHTFYSIASSLNMNYIEPIRSSESFHVFKGSAFNKNQARMFLSEQGYQFVTFYVPFIYTEIIDADVYFPLKNLSRSHTQRLAELLFPGSLGAILIEAHILAPSGLYRDYQEYLSASLQKMTGLSRMEGPSFVYFHILVPHEPYIFDQNGPIDPDSPYQPTRSFQGSPQEQIAYYSGQVSYISQLMEETIDNLLKNSDVPPIIIIQGDHGSRLDYDANYTTTCLEERSSILNAYYLPGLVLNPLYETITPVNSFRVIFNQYFGTDFDLLEDRTYYNNGIEAFTFTDVSRESQKQCFLP